MVVTDAEGLKQGYSGRVPRPVSMEIRYSPERYRERRREYIE